MHPEHIWTGLDEKVENSGGLDGLWITVMVQYYFWCELVVPEVCLLDSNIDWNGPLVDLDAKNKEITQVDGIHAL